MHHLINAIWKFDNEKQNKFSVYLEKGLKSCTLSIFET